MPSKAIHERLGSYGVKTPMHVLPTGVSIPAPASDGRHSFRERFGIDQSRPVALFVGRVAHEKNIDFLLDAVDLARESVPDILLVIAGEGPALSHLHKAVATRNLENNVLFIGYLDRYSDLPNCYAAADVFVFASRTETQGLVLLEAMTCGLPVVSLAEMGTIDILGAGRGAVVPADNPYAFALKLSEVLLDSGMRSRLSQEGREYAAEWSDLALAGRMADLYRQLVAESVRQNSADFNLLPL